MKNSLKKTNITLTLIGIVNSKHLLTAKHFGITIKILYFKFGCCKNALFSTRCLIRK